MDFREFEEFREFDELENFEKWLKSILNEENLKDFDVKEFLWDLIEDYETTGREEFEVDGNFTKSKETETYYYNVEDVLINEELERYKTIFYF